MSGLRERLLAQTGPLKPGDAPLQSPHRQYQSVLNSVGSVVCTVDRQLRVTYANHQWDEFARANDAPHLTGDRVLGQPLLDHLKGVSPGRWQPVCQQILRGQLDRYLDEIDNPGQTTWRHYSLTATPLRGTDIEAPTERTPSAGAQSKSRAQRTRRAARGWGQAAPQPEPQPDILGITFVITNITQLKKAESEMFKRLIEIRGLSQVALAATASVDRRKFYRQVTADIAQLFDAEKCVIFLWDEQTGHLQAQNPAYGLTGRKLAELWLDMGHPTDPDSLWLDLEEKDYILLNEGDQAPADVVETSARVDKLAAVMAVLRVSGRVHGTILLAGRQEPFSERDAQLLSAFAVPVVLAIENAELNQRLLDRIQQLAETRDELDHTHTIIEALPTPLNVVRGYCELLLDGVMGTLLPEQNTTLRLAATKIETIAGLVGRLCPPQACSETAHHQPVNLADLVSQAMYGRIVSIKQAELDLSIQLPAPYNQASLTLGDPALLNKAFELLVDAALQLSSEGGTIKTSLRTTASNDVVYVKVDIPSPGLSDERLLDIWTPSQRPAPVELEQVTLEPVSLAEVKRIIEGHGGQVWAKSQPGRGCTFYVALRKAPPVEP